MQRFTISLDATLAEQFDQLIAQRSYGNRSEAVRDLIRAELGTASLGGSASLQGQAARQVAKWCVATVTYVYDHHDHTAARRVLSLQHDHHDLVVTCSHVHLDHHDCLETVVLRGSLKAVQALAEQLVALRGVRHGSIHVVPLDQDQPHRHGAPASAAHTHLKPLT